jgi:flagellar motor switch protein FliM
MSGFLSSDQIEALFDRASEGALPVEADHSSGRRARWLRTVDFTRPSKFSTDQERRLRRALDTFCAGATTRLKAEHRTPVELEVIDVQQLTWSSAFSLLPEGSVHGTIECSPHEGRMLISAEVPLLLLALERLMGGTAEGAMPERELTDIDLMLVRRLLGTLVATLSSVWFDLSEVTLDIGDVETQPELVQVAAGAEPTLVLTMEARLYKVTSTVVLLVPYAAIAPVASAFSRHDEDAPLRDARTTEAVRHELGRVDLLLRAEIAESTLTFEELLALRPGDHVKLDGDGAKVTLVADRTPVLEARAGKSGINRAVQIIGPAEVES